VCDVTLDPMKKSDTTLPEGLDGLFSAIPEMRDLQRLYAIHAARLPTEERLAWIEAHTDSEILDEFGMAANADELGLTRTQLACAVLDDILRTWTESGSPQLLAPMLDSAVAPVHLDNGVTVLIATITQFSDLDALFSQIRNEHARTFPATGIRAETLDDLTFVLRGLGDGMKMTEIAWEFVYQDFPEAQALDLKTRKADYGDVHKKAYQRVRWLKSKALDSVNILAPEPSQKQE